GRVSANRQLRARAAGARAARRARPAGAGARPQPDRAAEAARQAASAGERRGRGEPTRPRPRRHLALGRRDRGRRRVSTTARVTLWGTRIGAVSIADAAGFASFQYEPSFLDSGIEVAPLTMPLRAEPYSFPALDPDSFHGLPGLLADSLPDRF